MGKKSGSGSGMNNPDHIAEKVRIFHALPFTSRDSIPFLDLVNFRKHDPDSDTANIHTIGKDPNPLGLTGHICFNVRYRRPILWTLYNALDFLKVLKIAVVGGGVTRT